MQFKIDENLPLELAELLNQAGFDAATVPSQKPEGKPDSIVFSVCQKEQRILVTLDVGFADIRRYPSGSHHGIIVMRLRSQDKSNAILAFQGVLSLFKTEVLVGKLWIVEEDRVRVRD